MHRVSRQHPSTQPTHLNPAGHIRSLRQRRRLPHLQRRTAQVHVVDTLGLERRQHAGRCPQVQGDGDVGLLSQDAVPFEVVFEDGIFKDRHRAKRLQFARQTRGLGQQGKFSIGINADRVVGSRRFFHQPHRLDDIPRTRLELVVAKAQPGPYFRLGRSLFWRHGARPVRHRHLVAHLRPKEAVQRNAVGLAGNVEQRAGESVRTVVRVQSQRILPHKSVGLLLTSRLFAEKLAPTLQALVRLHAAEGDVVDLGKVAGDHRDRRDFDFIQLYLSDFHRGPPLR